MRFNIFLSRNKYLELHIHCNANDSTKKVCFQLQIVQAILKMKNRSANSIPNINTIYI